ncbi:hypothetical protein K461DRAFT_318303 [Myriangium duriaei CBS 260.36]|uniref:G-patch domain-containing protein n=1 Tax=Myriangium duriaei CBS 260.36 TaxID=1168546 RepID=A0A9P4MJU1_9PEZI|nr:hypothetical protein K461DRAFT_318303 [Myriangium duriaei CBS 260.36]
MPSLYANLLNPPDKGATISAAPVKYDFKKQDEVAEDEKKADASLRFQPVKRPNVAQKPKPRPTPASLPSAKSPDSVEPDKKLAPGVAQSVSTIERWTAADDDYDGDPYAAEYNRRMDEARRTKRGGKKNKKKKNNSARYVDWDSIYDPERPTRLEDYQGSEEQTQAIHDWKMRLHAHQLQGKPSRDLSSSEDEYSKAPKKAFAPPPSYNFGPPATDIRRSQNSEQPEVSEPTTAPVTEPEPYVTPVPSAVVPDDASGEDAYQRRMRLSQQTAPEPSNAIPPTEPPTYHQAPTPAPNTQQPYQTPHSMPLPSHAPAPGTFNTPTPPPPPPSSATISSAPVHYSPPPPPSTLSAAPVHYSQPPPQEAPPPDSEPSSRPPKSSYGKRLLQKYGWTEGSGLGATGTGIVTPLRHQAEKRKKRPDADGGGWLGPAGGIGRIVGGKKARVDNAEAGGEWSIVAVFGGMLDGVDVQREMGEGTLMQDVGEAMGRFGVVERLFIDSSVGNVEGGARVFVKFTSALSAYRAIQAGDGKDFLGNGRTAQAAFYNADKFENGEYR